MGARRVLAIELGNTSPLAKERTEEAANEATNEDSPDRDGAQGELVGISRRLLGPVWAAAWFNLAYGALLLVPTFLPVYGAPLPNHVWWGLLGEAAVFLTLGAQAEARHRPIAYQWIAVALAGPGTAFAFTLGIAVLLSGAFDPISVGLVGVLCLVILVWADALASSAEAAPPTRWAKSSH